MWNHNVHKNCTFFELFWTKVSKIGVIQHFLAIFEEKMGHIAGSPEKQDVQKIALFLGNFGKKCSKPRK